MPIPRLPRREHWTEAACYHILNRGHNRDTIFIDAGDREYFRQLLHRYRDRFLLRFCHHSRNRDSYDL